MQSGSVTITIHNGSNYGTAVVTFPVAFTYKPLVLVSLMIDSTIWMLARLSALSSSQCTIFVSHDSASGERAVTVSWLAIGPE
jgi:hypothetical protein